MVIILYILKFIFDFFRFEYKSCENILEPSLLLGTTVEKQRLLESKHSSFTKKYLKSDIK